jgi:hypothetical protein
VHPHRGGILNGMLLTLLALSVAVNLYLYLTRAASSTTTISSRAAPLDEIQVMRTAGGMLVVSRIRAPERFDASQQHRFLGVPLGQTLSQIQVPAVYTYQIELAPEWKVTIRDKTFLVIAPIVKPQLPVAIDTTRLSQFSAGLWSPITGAAQREALLKGLSGELAAKAASSSYIEFQREAARETVTEFVRHWVQRQERWKEARDLSIRVLFADEPIGQLARIPAVPALEAP